ncbi:MAG: DUF59 domain-containing protein [Planctomyces sp.]|nr:DUF59 domain-containing protein [Planctomyces sp.]
MVPSCPVLTWRFQSKSLFACVIIVMLTATTVRSQESSAPVLSAAERSDSFEEKMKLLQEAWERRDFELARSLTHSLRDTVIQTQHEEEPAGQSLIPAEDFRTSETLPEEWRRWSNGWKYFKTLTIEETAGEIRRMEPVEIRLSFPGDQITSLRRELRLARISNHRLTEVPCQVFHEVTRQGLKYASILWMAEPEPLAKQTYFVFYGNPNAELPEYPSDLDTKGEGFALDISNAYYKASLSRQTGQLERITLRREHGLELFSGGEGHGEPPGIDWAHDYVDTGSFQKLRISLWETCPDFEIIRGPICTIVRRWGFPHSPVHPIYTPSRLKVSVEYRFYTGLPWFQKTGTMTAVKNFRAEALRDDEWVFSGQSFTDSVWMNRDGKLLIGDVPAESQKDIHGVGFFHRQSKDSFISLFLEHSAEGLPELAHTGAPIMYYRWHGAVWSRYPLPVKDVPEGAVLKQKNAYISIPFTEADGPQQIEQLRRCLVQPVRVAAASTLVVSESGVVGDAGVVNDGSVQPGQLARPGESGDSSVPKEQIWEALRDCKDAQLYTADINLVELGLIQDVRVRGGVVTVVMSMPHRGRSRPGYFIDGSISVHPTLSVPIRERIEQVPGVQQVVVIHTWDPEWNSNRITPVGRTKLGLPEN